MFALCNTNLNETEATMTKTIIYRPDLTATLCEICDRQIDEDYLYCADCGEVVAGYQVSADIELEGWENEADYRYDMSREMVL